MLHDPGRYATCDWNPRRLVVQHMTDATCAIDDDSFDGEYCSSSIKHFGDLLTFAWHSPRFAES